MSDLTIGIATCGRPNVLNKCIRSLKKYSGMEYELIIVDNTSAFTDDKKAYPKNLPTSNVIHIDKKIGCCESNNIIADACETEYLMHLDDDIFIDSHNIIKNMYDLIKESNIPTIIGGTWYDTFYNGFRHQCMKYIYGIIEGFPTVKKLPIPYEYTNILNYELINTDECLHSMILRKDDVYDLVKWDNKFKWKGDRLDFFTQCINNDISLYTYCKQNFIHSPKEFEYGSISYEDFDGKEAIEYFKNKWNVFPIVGWDKKQIKEGNI
jgi:GT2 family glycosyltransferase